MIVFALNQITQFQFEGKYINIFYDTLLQLIWLVYDLLAKLLEIFLYNAVGYEQAFHELFKFPHYVEMGINVSTGYQVEC